MEGGETLYKTFSINEREQIKERLDLQARQKARDKEREARKDSGITVYEITVENADKPGLSEALGNTALNATSADTNKIDSAGSSHSVSAAADKKSGPPVDPVQTETENILEDYISALSSSHTLIAK